MNNITLQNIPNQEFDITLDEVDYTIRLRTVRDFTLADIEANGELLKSGVRCVPGIPLLPYKYLTRGGNFFFMCLDGNYPYYTQFGVTQELIYISDSELAEAGNG